MKEISAYKIIDVKNTSELNTLFINHELSNNKYPIVINLEKISPLSTQALAHLEKSIHEQFSSIYFPYPIYCLGTAPDYSGPLTFYKSKAELPTFFPFKGKVTAKIHSELLHYNQIAQREFECINYNKAKEIIRNYGHIQKKIFNSHIELNALNKIMNLAQIENLKKAET